MLNNLVYSTIYIIFVACLKALLWDRINEIHIMFNYKIYIMESNKGKLIRAHCSICTFFKRKFRMLDGTSRSVCTYGLSASPRHGNRTACSLFVKA